MKVNEWFKKHAINVLKEFGLKLNQKVLDFGCGSGIYTLLASTIVGKTGKVYSLDCEDEKIKELSEKVKENDIENVELIKTNCEVEIPLENNFLDIVLLYDVLHLIKKKERKKLLGEINRVLKKDGILSFFLTHPNEIDMGVVELEELINNKGFQLKEKLLRPMFHWDWIEEGMVFNFLKR